MCLAAKYAEHSRGFGSVWGQMRQSHADIPVGALVFADGAQVSALPLVEAEEPSDLGGAQEIVRPGFTCSRRRREARSGTIRWKIGSEESSLQSF
jgi:hypothetical protein